MSLFPPKTCREPRFPLSLQRLGALILPLAYPKMQDSESSFFCQPSTASDALSSQIPLDIPSSVYRYYKVCVDGRLCFLKALRPEHLSEQYWHETLRKEYELGVQLTSDYVVRYVRLTDHADECSVLMDYVNGQTLAEVLEQEPTYFLKKANLRKFLLQLCLALHDLHSHAALHLDLKPSNIMLTHVNHDLRLIDLGCGYMDVRPDTIGHTARYSAPEQLAGNLDLDARTDIYALGRVLAEIGDRLPSPYRQIAARAMSQRREDRYQTVDAAATFVLLAAAVGGAYWHQSGAAYELRDSLFLYADECDSVFLRVLSVAEQSVAVVQPPDSLCPYTDDFILPDSVVHEGHVFYITDIDSSAFANCRDLGNIKLPATLTTIGHEAFAGCLGLHNIHLPPSLREVKMAAFINCSTLAFISWPASVVEVPRNCFVACKGLRQIELPEGVTTIRQDAFCDCASLTDISLPASLVGIDRGAFYKCISLRTITLPAGITQLGEYLFYECSSLSEIRLLAPEPPAISTIVDTSFHGVVRVPTAALEAYKKAPSWKYLNLEPL